MNLEKIIKIIVIGIVIKKFILNALLSCSFGLFELVKSTIATFDMAMPVIASGK